MEWSDLAPFAPSWSTPSGTPGLIGRKRVDWSVFEDGTTIPAALHDAFRMANGGARLARGEAHPAQLLIDGHPYRASFINVDRKGVRSDTLQIRYDSNTALKEYLRLRFRTSYEFLQANRSGRVSPGHKLFVRVPDALGEYLDFVSTGTPFVYDVRTVVALGGLPEAAYTVIRAADERELERAFGSQGDEQFRKWLDTAGAKGGLVVKEGLVRVRRYDRSVVQLLRRLYGGACQICQWSARTPFGVDVSEGHHIRPFSISLDNSPRNIVVMCPTHHAVVHATEAAFDRQARVFTCRHGGALPLSLNVHI